MVNVGFFFLELFLLFLLSRRVTRGFSLFLYKIFRSEKIAVGVMAFIFFPGTFLHEMSHYVMAVLLGVRAGKIEFWPEIHGNSVKMGSVSIAKSDALRRFLIGVAPVVWGTVVILCLVYFATRIDVLSNLILSGVILFGIFVVGNTMYSSRRDMEGALGFFLMIGILILSVVTFLVISGTGIPDIDVAFFRDGKIYEIFSLGWKFLLVPVAVNVFFVTATYLFIRR